MCTSRMGATERVLVALSTGTGLALGQQRASRVLPVSVPAQLPGLSVGKVRERQLSVR